MARRPNQKMKLLYLMRILLQGTDEEHALTLQQILDELERRGVSAERKSIYDDIEALRVYGVDVCSVKSKTTGYYVGSRTFELPELKLLVDSVQASQFITEKKSMALIKKLETLCSCHQAQLMRRQVYVANRIKNMNESIYYNVDSIHSAIAQGRKIAFGYFEYTVQKTRNYRHSGVRYRVSPFALTWDSENYYLIAFDTDAGIFKHYRVDKMDEIEITPQARDGEEQYKALDMAVYTKRVFSMFGGEEERVRIEFADQLAGVVLDRFGKDVMIAADGQGRFRIDVPVIVSPQFYGWVFGLGEGARILGPAHVVDGMREHVGRVKGMY